MDLRPLFATLPVPDWATTTDRFTVVPVPGHAAYLLARDQQGAPAVLIAHVHDTGRLLRVELQHLRVVHGARCRIQRPTGEEEIVEVSVIRCSPDPDLEPVFLRLMGGLVAELGEPSPEALTRLIVQLVDLFRSLSGPPRKSVQGLWGELFLIEQSSDPVQLVEAWHTDPGDMYDFNAGHQRIEVKSSASPRRSHHFQLQQLLPPTGTELMVYSLLTHSAGGGATVADLLEEIELRVAERQDLVVRLESVVAETLGEQWRTASHLAFDRELARASVRFLAVDDVPSIPAETIPNAISNVRFEVSLADLEGRPTDILASEGGLFAAAVPA